MYFGEGCFTPKEVLLENLKQLKTGINGEYPKILKQIEELQLDIENNVKEKEEE